MSRIALAASLSLAVAGFMTEAVSAQWRDQTPRWPRAPVAVIAPQELMRSPAPVGPTVLSLVLPGAGQHVLGQRRKWVYLALEAAGWAAYLNRRHAGSDLRDRYRDFAWENGRIQVDGRVEGPFAYYEALSKWTRSGSFDSDVATPGLQPELDPATYNGSIWDRATRIFFPGGAPVPETDPAYQSAVGYYGEHAYGAEFLWDWSAAPEAQQEFANLIHISDHRFRQATTVLGLVIANHLISAGDAYLSARARVGGAQLRLEPAERGSEPGWWAVLHVPVGG